MSTVTADAIGAIVSDTRLLRGHRIKFNIHGLRYSNLITIGEKNYATASINDPLLVLSDAEALSELLATPNGATHGTWPARLHGAVKRVLIARGLGLVAIPRLGKLSHSRSPSLHASRCAVMNTPASMREIMAYATPYATGTDMEVHAARAASRGSSTEDFRTFLHMGIDPNLLLASACEGGNLSFVRQLIWSGADPDTTANPRKSTPLFIATQYNHIDVMQYLIEEAFANPSKLCFNGVSPIMYAAFTGKSNAVDILVHAGADINTREPTRGMTPLLGAIQFNRPSIFNRLIDANADLRICGFDGLTPLMTSSNLGLADCTERLIEKGAQVNAVNAVTGPMEGATPLIYAAGKGHVKIVELLIKKGAQVNARCADGCTALFWACQQGCVPVVRILLEKGADKTIEGIGMHGRIGSRYTPSTVARAALHGSNQTAILTLLA